MKQKRQHPRRRTNDYYTVVDCTTAELLGRVGNISLGGLMVISEEPLQARQSYCLKIVFSHRIEDRDHLQLETECCWSVRNDMANWWESGFQIRALQPSESAFLQRLLHQLMLTESERLNARDSKFGSSRPRLQYVRDRSAYDRHMLKTHLKS